MGARGTETLGWAPQGYTLLQEWDLGLWPSFLHEPCCQPAVPSLRSSLDHHDQAWGEGQRLTSSCCRLRSCPTAFVLFVWSNLHLGSKLDSSFEFSKPLPNFSSCTDPQIFLPPHIKHVGPGFSLSVPGVKIRFSICLTIQDPIHSCQTGPRT